MTLSAAETAGGIKLRNTVPRSATAERKIRVADTAPAEKTVSCLLCRPSSTIFAVSTLPQKTTVRGLDRVRIRPCRNRLPAGAFTLRPGMKLYPKGPRAMFRPNSSSTAPPSQGSSFLARSFSSSFPAPRPARAI